MSWLTFDDDDNHDDDDDDKWQAVWLELPAKLC